MNPEDKSAARGSGEITPFGPYLDYLLLNYQGIPEGDLLQILKEKQANLRERGESGGYVGAPNLPGGNLYLFAYRPSVEIADCKKYPYHFRNEMFQGALTTWENLPPLRIRFHTRKLYEHSLEKLDALSREIGEYFFNGAPKIQVSRADLALDFQLPGFQMPNMADVVTYAGSQKREKDKHNNSDTFTLGRNSKKRSLQIYNKTSKIEYAKQHFMYDVYEQSGGYDNSLEIFRVELRFKRSYLRDMRVRESGRPNRGIETVLDLKESRGDLIRDTLGNKETRPWARFCDAKTRGKDGRPAALWWTGVVEAFKKDMPSSYRLSKRSARHPNFTRDRDIALSWLIRLAAHEQLRGRLPNTSMKEFLHLLRLEMEGKLHLKHTTFEEAVAEKVNLLKEKPGEE